ncbi:MAG: hypothetical protein IJR83_00390 [Clostridia bacterium]|nr:hypothetical protein [Clostridia bacterium]
MRRVRTAAGLLVIVILLLSFAGCYAAGADADLSGFSPQAQTAIRDFVRTWGKDSEGYRGDAYIVSDFDNTTSIFDITYQCSVYQIQTMSFAMSAEELRAALSVYAETDETAQKYISDVVAAYEKLLPDYGPFTPAGVGEDRLDSLHEELYWKEFATKLKCLYLYLEGVLDDASGCAWIMYWYTNMTADEVYDLFLRSCLRYRDTDTVQVTWTSPEGIESEMGVTSCTFLLGCSVTESVKNMLTYYYENGIDTWICSASHVDGVRAAVDAYGLSGCITGVIGMTQKTDGGRFLAEYDYEDGRPYFNDKGSWRRADESIRALPAREGKVIAIENFLVPLYKAGPLAGFMDASGDFNFCTEFESMKMVICYNRADRKITDGAGLVAIAAVCQQQKGLTLAQANAAGDTYYILQGRDENGKRKLSGEQTTVRYGAESPALFATEASTVLLDHMKDRDLSLKDFFNTFAIATSEQDSAIGLAYGYLSDYRGYHSVRIQPVSG